MVNELSNSKSSNKILYPTDFRGNLEYRFELKNKCHGDIELAAYVREYCARDIEYWFDVFCWTYDPRKNPSVIPMILWDFQREILCEIKDAIINQADILIVKSRDMAISWTVTLVQQWLWQFSPSQCSFLVGSRKEDYVDKLGDIDSLLEKIRFNIRKQPSFLLPVGFNEAEHLGFMSLKNPETGSIIKGESSNSGFSRSGRHTAIMLDEFAFWNYDDQVETATADTSRCRIYVSTPCGMANVFGTKAKSNNSALNVVYVHWSLHPDKTAGCYYWSNQDTQSGVKIPVDNPCVAPEFKAFKLFLGGYKIRSEWYDAECERREKVGKSNVEIAQELDCEFVTSGYSYFSVPKLRILNVWKESVRANSKEKIPHMSFIRTSLFDIDKKIQVRDNAIDGWLQIYEEPTDYHQYVIGCDSSEGSATGDYQAAIVLNQNKQVCAIIHGHYSIEDFIERIALTAKYYNNAKVAAENNSIGGEVNRGLYHHRLGVNLYYMPDERDKKDKKYGFNTNSRTRPMVLEGLSKDLSCGNIDIRSQQIISECEMFVSNPNTGKISAAEGFHDDLVMALAIGNRVVTETPYKPKTQKSTVQRAMLNDVYKRSFARM